MRHLQFYDIVYNAWRNDEITDTQWHEFCTECLQELMAKNRDVLERLK